MTDERASTDGGETTAPVDIERAGDAPPEPPTDDGLGRLLPDLLEGTESVTTVYMVRASLEDGSGHSVGERLVDAIEDQVTVVGTTLEEGLDPEDPELDVLIETDHDHGAVASSLARVGPVDGVVVADVTTAAESELEEDATAEDAPEEVDAENANEVFQELQEEVGQEGYGEVVDELEDVSFQGGPDPEEEVDLEAEAGIDLEGEGAEPAVAGAGSDPQEGDLELEEDEVSTKELLGEADRDDVEETKAPDEQEIEEAVSEVDVGAGPEESPEAGAGAGDLDTGGDLDDQIPTPDDLDTGGGASDDAEEEEAGAAGDTAEADAGDAADDATAPEAGADAEAGPGETEAGSGAGGADAGAGGVGDGSGEADREAGAPDAATGGAPAVPADGDMDAFVAQLVEALESGAVDEQRRTELREALGVEKTNSLDARLEHVQKRVDDLAAYTDAWESFLEEQGSGREFVETVREDIEELKQRLAAVEGGAGGDLDGLESRLSDIEATLEELDERHDEDVARLDTRVDDAESRLEGRIDQLEDAVGALKEKVKALLEWRERIDDVIGE